MRIGARRGLGHLMGTLAGMVTEIEIADIEITEMIETGAGTGLTVVGRKLQVSKACEATTVR